MEIEMLPDRNKIVLILRRPNRPDYRDRFDPVSAKQRARIAAECGVSTDDIAAMVEDVQRSAASKIKRFETQALPAESFCIRPLTATRNEGERLEAEPRAALARLNNIPVDSVMEWSDAKALCCLDVDYHGVQAPGRDWLTTLMLSRLHPRPIAWHFSRSGGIHAFYIASDPLAADELAAVAALRYRALDGTAGLELKTVVRGPGAEVISIARDQDTGVGFAEWLGSPEYDESERANWLESEGMELDKRYEHERCPIAPCSSHAEPVVVSEQGIYCHRCASTGMTLGCRRPGFVPWATILGAPSAGELGRMVRNLVHWGHAKWVLTQTYGFPEALAKKAYAAALKLYHNGKALSALVSRVFSRDTEDYARVGDAWMSIPTLYIYPNTIQPVLEKLPAAQFLVGDEVKVNKAAVCDLAQFKDQTPRGYAGLELVHGVKLAEAGRRLTVTVPNPDLVRHDSRRVARYLPRGERMTEAEAWSEIEKIVPRIDRTLIKLLTCAFSIAQETRAGLLPILFVSGPSGAAKSATCKVAAGIYGSRCGEATFEADPTHYRASIREAAARSPVVILNEMLKEGARARLSTRQTLDMVLTLTPDSMSHALYRGPVPMGRLPAIVITEPVLPMTVRDETQLARRIRHHRVTGRKDDWPAAIQAAGVPSQDLTLIRATSETVAKACDSILSYVADAYLAFPRTWDAIAEDLGCATVEKDENFSDLTPWHKELFRLVCAEPALTGRDAKVYAHGYKKIIKEEHEKPLNVVYSMFADGYGSDWSSSRRLQEKAWESILGVDGPVFLDMRSSGSNVFIRFRVGPDKKPLAVNEQIVDPSSWETIS